MKEKEYCIYRHLTVCGKVFYIGISDNFKRPYNKYDRSKEWKELVSSVGNYEVDILTTGLSKQEACEFEILLISWYGRIDCCGGTLVNLTDGGETGFNWIPSEAWRKHRSEIIKGENNPNYGNKWSDEQKQKASKKMLGRYAGDKNPMYGVTRESPFKGKKHTEESKILLRKPRVNNRGENHYYSKIVLNLETGIFYYGIEDAFSSQYTYKSLSHFTAVLAGKYKNKTSFIIC